MLSNVAALCPRVLRIDETSLAQQDQVGVSQAGLLEKDGDRRQIG